jgi:hypothetical protein
VYNNSNDTTNDREEKEEAVVVELENINVKKGNIEGIGIAKLTTESKYIENHRNCI